MSQRETKGECRLKPLVAIFCALSLFLLACGGTKTADRVVSGSGDSGDRPEQAERADCSKRYSAYSDSPAEVALSEACLQLRQMQVSLEVQEPVVEMHGDLSATVVVTAALSECQKACVSEVWKSFETFVNLDKKWEIRASSDSFVETEASRQRRLADEKEIRFAGITVDVLAKETKLEDDGSIVVPVVVSGAPADNSVFVLLRVILPNGEQTVYRVNHYTDASSGGRSQQAVLYQKPSNERIYYASELTSMGSRTVTIDCYQLGSFVLAGTVSEEITSDCLPVLGEK